MSGKAGRKKFIRYAVALMCAAVLLAVSVYKEEKTESFEVVILGDSVVGNVWHGNNIAILLEEYSGKTVFNGAFGGSCMSMSTNNLWGSMSNMEWCMVKLAEAICYQDWTSQSAVMQYADSYSYVNTQALDYFAERMEVLSRIDFSQTEILIIEHGTNDYNSGTRLDNPDDLYDETTFGGALRYSLRLLKESYPNLRIMVMSPIYCALGENKDVQCYNTSYGEGGTLDEYVALERQIAEEFEVEWIDAYHGSGIWVDNADIYLKDALHPDVAGLELLARLLADSILENAK